MKTLAIVIPAYKSAYLDRTLQSLVNQTCQRFHLYIGDDNSPFTVYEVIKPYFKQLDITYVRFDTNLGGTSLVQQWRRCVNLTSEDYIWLFSDDDLLPIDAVERFWKFEEQMSGKFDICRLQLDFINRDDQHLLTYGRHPEWQTAKAFLIERLQGQTLSAASEYIFTREVYKKYGFVEFPVAWCSDDASWIQMGEQKGLFTIEGLPVLMRMSGDNISSSNYQRAARLDAVLQFASWIRTRYILQSQILEHYIRNQINLLHLPLYMRFRIWYCKSVSKKWRLALIMNSRLIYKLIIVLDNHNIK